METLKALEEGTIVSSKTGRDSLHIMPSMLNKRDGKHRLERFRQKQIETTDPGIEFLAECVYTLGRIKW